MTDLLSRTKQSGASIKKNTLAGSGQFCRWSNNAQIIGRSQFISVISNTTYQEQHKLA